MWGWVRAGTLSHAALRAVPSFPLPLPVLMEVCKSALGGSVGVRVCICILLPTRLGSMQGGENVGFATKVSSRETREKERKNEREKINKEHTKGVNASWYVYSVSASFFSFSLLISSTVVFASSGRSLGLFV